MLSIQTILHSWDLNFKSCFCWRCFKFNRTTFYQLFSKLFSQLKKKFHLVSINNATVFIFICNIFLLVHNINETGCSLN